MSGNSGDRPRPRHPLNQRMTREQGREEGTNRGTGVITSDRVHKVIPIALSLCCLVAITRIFGTFSSFLPRYAEPGDGDKRTSRCRVVCSIVFPSLPYRLITRVRVQPCGEHLIMHLARER